MSPSAREAAYTWDVIGDAGNQSTYDPRNDTITTPQNENATFTDG